MQKMEDAVTSNGKFRAYMVKGGDQATTLARHIVHTASHPPAPAVEELQHGVEHLHGLRGIAPPRHHTVSSA
jgi:hypothetical protein